MENLTHQAVMGQIREMIEIFVLFICHFTLASSERFIEE